MLGNKIKRYPNTALIKGNDVITDEKLLAETFYNYFVNVVLGLAINIVDDNSDKGDASYYNNHSSIINIKHFLSKFQCGFRQGFNTQHCLLIIKEKLRKI